MELAALLTIAFIFIWLGAWLGDLIGWRGAFALIVPVAVLALVWQRIHMPPLPPRGIRRSNPLGLLSQPQVALGMGSIFLLFMGQFALFTYPGRHAQ